MTAIQRTLLYAVTFLFASFLLQAQAPATQEIGFGAGWNGAVAPQVQFLQRVASNAYSYTIADLTSAVPSKSYKPATAVRTGLAYALHQWGPVGLYVLGDLGAAIGEPGAHTVTTLSSATGGFAEIALGSSGLKVHLGGEVQKDAMGNGATPVAHVSFMFK